MSNSLAHFTDLRSWNVHKSVSGVEFRLFIELRHVECLAVILEESLRFDVDEAGSQVLISNVAVFVDIDVLREGEQILFASLFVDLLLEEVGEFIN